ncbi:hypothetical protein BDZ97DRAFT_1832056, partial [Flammula alnicola]
MSHLLRPLSTFKSVYNLKRDQYQYTLAGIILDSELALLEKYGTRVRTLVYSPEPDVDPSVYLQLVQRTNKPFFPRLRNLCITGYGPEVALLVSSSLLRVHAMPQPYTGRENHPIMWSFFDSVVQQAPDMQYLHIGFRVPKRRLDCISKLENLRHLGLSQDLLGGLKTRLDSTFFAKLAHMEHLSSVDFNGLVNSRNELRRSAFGDFCSLTKLTITSTLQQVVPLLQSGSFCALESFTLAFTEAYKSPREISLDFEETSWHAFFQALRQNTGQRFKELNLGCDMTYSRYGTDKYPYALPAMSDMPAPIYPDLLKLNLTKVNIAYAAFWSLSPAHMRGFIKAWPDIEELHIFTPSVGTIDFHALIEVAEHLPHLRSLLFSLQTENMPEPDSVPFLSHHLVSLDVWTSPVVKPAHLNIAIGLFKLFPTIRYLQHDTRGRYSSLWRRVGTIIPFLKEAARNQNTISGRDGDQPTSGAHFHSGLRVH